MTWLRLTDKAHMDPRVLTAGNAAFGMFVRCADWSADHLTDGFIPTAIARLYGTRAELDRATAAGLWHPTRTPEPGFVIDGFTDPAGWIGARSRDAVLEERSKAAARQRRHRHGEVTDMSRRDTTVSHDPPDLTRPEPPEVHLPTTTTLPTARPPSSSSGLLNDAQLAEVLTLVAEAITVAANPPANRWNAYRHGVLRNLIAEQLPTIQDRLADGTTPLQLAAEHAGGEVYAARARRNLNPAREA